MKDQLVIVLKKYPFFLFMLPVFFVLHGARENYDFVPVTDALLLTGIYFTVASLLLFLFRLLYKGWLKAALASFFLLSFHLFFGAIQDKIRELFPGSFINKYAFILPVSLVFVVTIILVLKKVKRPLRRLSYYLNVLLLFLVVIDALWLTVTIINGTKAKHRQLPEEFVNCGDCPKPDVYVIIADEYAGNTELKDIFHFDNTPFLDELRRLGFHIIPNSSSNYNYTPYSIASILNMDYLDLENKNHQQQLIYTYKTTQNNRLLRFFLSHQYRFYNLSLIDYEGQPAQAAETFLPFKTRLITDQTFLSRLNKELRYHLVTFLRSGKEIRRLTYGTGKNNEYFLKETIAVSKKKISQPKFVLTHLMMPHYPYYFDKNGTAYPFEQVVEGNQHNQHHYIEYLQYCNKKLYELVDGIIKNSPGPPVILFFGDHGFRHFLTPVDMNYHYMNMTAVYLPGKNYSAFTDSMTSVNLLRAMLNTEFGQHLAYLKDTAYIVEQP